MPLSQEKIDTFLREQRFRCLWCQRPIGYLPDDWRPTVDHIVPLSHDGSEGDHNKCLTCGECNSAKGDKPLRVFLTELHRRRKLEGKKRKGERP